MSMVDANVFPRFLGVAGWPVVVGWLFLDLSLVLTEWTLCELFCRASVSSLYGEFDPGSGRTLAACLTHASRTVIPLRWGISGERVSNT